MLQRCYKDIEYSILNFSDNGELICAMPIVQGPCEAAIPSWGLEGRQFNYGGCDGNDNRFEYVKTTKCQSSGLVSVWSNPMTIFCDTRLFASFNAHDYILM